MTEECLRAVAATCFVVHDAVGALWGPCIRHGRCCKAYVLQCFLRLQHKWESFAHAVFWPDNLIETLTPYFGQTALLKPSRHVLASQLYSNPHAIVWQNNFIQTLMPYFWQTTLFKPSSHILAKQHYSNPQAIFWPNNLIQMQGVLFAIALKKLQIKYV